MYINSIKVHAHVQVAEKHVRVQMYEHIVHVPTAVTSRTIFST